MKTKCGLRQAGSEITDVAQCGGEGGGEGLTRLQRDLVDRMTALFRSADIQPGDRLTELGLAERLKVSRTPVRGALAHLESLGILGRQPRSGFVLLRRPPPPISRAAVSEDDSDNLIVAIARDRTEGNLANSISESDLMRRYSTSRQAVLRALMGLAEIGIVTRKPGYGWEFAEEIDDLTAREESFRFRLLIEPGALREPTFRLDPAWASDMRAQHESLLGETWSESMGLRFFGMNSKFHEGLARASGNRFIHLAFSHQNRLRQFRHFNRRLDAGQVALSCRQHLDILDRLEEGDQEIASLLMYRHLIRTSARI